MSLRIGRWEADYHFRAIHIQQLPDPRCTDCGGDGGWWGGSPVSEEPDPVPCPCTAGLRHIRIPLWRRNTSNYSEEPPF